MSEQPPNQPMTFNSFADWCLNKDCLSTKAKHTLEELLKCAGTSDCHEAERILSSRTELFLRFRSISDLLPLQTLANLTHLYLHNNRISDLLPLQTLTNLSVLFLLMNEISDLLPLRTLTNLTSLFLDFNEISDLLPLQTLSKLTCLALSDNQISDLLPLQTLTNLTTLGLSNNQISDLLPLQTLTNLTFLSLTNNQISDLLPLRTLTNLTFLDLRNNQIEIVFCPSPDAARAWLCESKQLGSSLQQQLLQLKKKLVTPALRLKIELQSRSERQIAEQLVQQLEDDLEDDLDDYSVDSKFDSKLVTPAYLADVISLTQFSVSHFRCVLELEEQEVLRCLNQLVEHCGWIFPFEKVCLVCDRPRQLRFDNQQRLHAEGEPAIQFADGYSLYCYHGVTLPEKYGKLHPNQWQAQWLVSERNAELRRVLIQEIGYERICQELQATELDSWQEYTLLQIDEADIEPIYLLKMTCPSSGLVHTLRVPPNMQSAREAIRWVNWGIDPEEFSAQT